MDAVSEIKARLPIEELVSSYCQLTRKGRTLKALCPFHNDTHPSLTVSPDKGIAYCFACQAGGDIFSFYQKIENVDFPQALKDLAEKARVELPKGGKQEGLKKDEKQRLRDCLDAAAAFYRRALQECASAQEYLAKRGVTEDLAVAFRIGFAPDSFEALYTHLLKLGFSRKEILAAGLGVQKELQEERIYDRFRNRMMFPITDPQGTIVGFGGRTLGSEDAKYINSPDGPLYSKSAALFGLSLAREAIRTQKCVILVEGYFDVLALHRLGIRNVVAVSGTALTEQHAQILKRFTQSILLCLDADVAGQEAAERAFVTLAKQDLDVRSLRLPCGKDPDECALREPDALVQEAGGAGVPYLEAVLADMRGKTTEKRGALHRLLPLLRAVHSSVLREEYVRKTAEFLGVTMTAVEDDLRRTTQERILQPPSPGRHAHAAPFTSTELFLGLLLTYPSHRSLLEQLIEPEEEGERTLAAALRVSFASAGNKTLPRAPRTTDFPEAARERANIIHLYCEEHFGAWSETLIGRELRWLLRKANRDLLLRKHQRLLSNLEQARASGKKLEEEQLFTQCHKVLKLLKLAG